MRFYRAACAVSALFVWVSDASGQSRAPSVMPSTSSRLALRLVTATPARWLLEIRNPGERPAHVVDDLRLLRLRIDRAQGKDVTCSLPRDLVSGVSQKALPIAPGEVRVRPFDPRYFCFHERTALTAGARITPLYGFGERACAVGVGTGGAAACVLEGQPVVLDAAMVGSARAAAPPPPRQLPAPRKLELSMVRGSDAADELGVTATVRLRNASDSRAMVYFRRSLLAFEVDGPSGKVACHATGGARRPPRAAFRTLVPDGDITSLVRLVELCPRGTFTAPGVYSVRAHLQARADGSRFGLEAFTGTLTASKPAMIRVRRGLELLEIRPVPASVRAKATKPPPKKRPVRRRARPRR